MTKQKQIELLNRYTTQHIVYIFYGLSPTDSQYQAKTRTVRNYKNNGLPDCNQHLISRLVDKERKFWEQWMEKK